MSGISITVDASDFDDAIRRLRPLFNFDGLELMTIIGALGESQTRRRIEEEKTAPDGTAWPPNSQGTPILVETGQHLLSSIVYVASPDQAEWGATWPLAHVHQTGMTIKPVNGSALKFWWQSGGFVDFAVVKQVTIPARPFVGLSSENRAEILAVITDHLGVLQ